jgi:hypothetical protein
VVVIAGYTQPMEDFLMSNPGLKSRFESRIIFSDYSRGELGQILEKMANREGFILNQDALEKTVEYLAYLKNLEPHFGNGRAVRNVFGEMKMCLARRMMTELQCMDPREISKETLITFTRDDVPDLLASDSFQKIKDPQHTKEETAIVLAKKETNSIHDLPEI